MNNKDTLYIIRKYNHYFNTFKWIIIYKNIKSLLLAESNIVSQLYFNKKKQYNKKANMK